MWPISKFCYFVSFYCPSKKFAVVKELSRLHSSVDLKHCSDYGQQCIHACMLGCFSHGQLFATPWTIAHQAPLSWYFSWQEHWSGLHALLQGIFPTQELNLLLLHLLHCRQILYCSATREAQGQQHCIIYFKVAKRLDLKCSHRKKEMIIM